METSVAHTSRSIPIQLSRTNRSKPVHDDLDLDNEELNARVEEGLEDFFVRQRNLMGEDTLPEGCVSLESSYRKTINRLNESYA